LFDDITSPSSEITICSFSLSVGAARDDITGRRAGMQAQHSTLCVSLFRLQLLKTRARKSHETLMDSSHSDYGRQAKFDGYSKQEQCGSMRKHPNELHPQHNTHKV
jgi:hypothetical protein